MNIRQHKTMFRYLWILDSDMKIQQHKKNVLLFLNIWQWHGNSTTQKEYFVTLNIWEWYKISTTQKEYFVIFKYLTLTWKFNNTKRMFC